MLTYRVTTDTSTLRVRAWRILRRIGAASLQQSVYIVPARTEVIKKLNKLKFFIEEAGGNVHWLDVDQFSENTQTHMIELMNLERSAEFIEFRDECVRFIREVSTYKEPTLHGSIEDWVIKFYRLRKWFRKLTARDYFQCSNRSDAEDKLRELESLLSERLDINLSG
ncbi:Chromate resistance protein ChrB [Ferroacidibacillus organovorans]|uniref:Chromate resistance protein ChrB n=1 Tax=Ferroacidibacillus organovorans TaxID=1765683 RepID=UPI002FF75426